MAISGNESSIMNLEIFTPVLEMSEFYILVISAMIVSFIPIIRKPFRMIEVFLHELSHGLGTCVTFGKVHKLHLNFNGSGYCLSSGGFRTLSLMAGYAGASTFGFLIYYIAISLQTQHAETLLYSAMVFLIFITFLWVRDVQSLICMIMIICLFYLPLEHQLFQITSFYLKFIGLYVCLSALRSPLDLIDGKDVGDGADLFKQTLIPEFVWIILWVVYGGFCLYNIYLLENLTKTSFTIG
ncbi:MAG: M50 family metallopeptidase [Proteobacteria bacterium]|nr:M50 family metallopeptidase [Pseudomonadota bacterium]